MIISSVHNKKILQLRKLYKSRERKLSDVFVAEGVKEVERGIKSGFEVVSLYYCPDIYSRNISELLRNTSTEIPVFELEKKVYEKVAYRDNTEGVLAVFRKKVYTLNDFVSDENSLFVVLESVEKPGNLGAVLRTADAANVNAIILTESRVDQYHPNVIRSSIGAAFTVPVVVTTNIELKQWFDTNNIGYYSAALPSYTNIYNVDMKKSIAVIFGTESQGLSSFWLKEKEKIFTIPMSGIVDSLNVSVSVAVTVYEALRQRNSL